MKETDKYQDSNRNNKHLDENELAQYADYLRHETDQMPEGLVEHVAGCSYCRGELMAITDMLDAMPDSLPDIAEEAGAPEGGYSQPAKRGTPVTLPGMLKTVAAVAAVIVFAWFILQLLPEGPMNEPIATNKEKDSTLTPDTLTPNLLTSEPLTSNLPASGSSAGIGLLSDTVRYAEAFLPDPTYESLVNAKYRSGSDPKVRGPGPATIFYPGDTLKVSWTPDPEDDYLLVILDNKANPVAEVRAGSKSYISWKIDLKPGLYYWKFLGKEEMWKVGRMKVMGSGAHR